MLKFRLLTAGVCLSLFLTGCPWPIEPAPGIERIDSDIDDETTWTSGNKYLIKTANFSINAPLVIEPGVIVKFDTNLGPSLSLGSGGSIVAVGTSSDPIIFTSYRDDYHGGDTNSDATATSPAAEDWGGINLNGTEGCRFEYCHFLYGGGGGDNATYTLALDSGSIATIKNCLFARNYQGEEGYGALDAHAAADGTEISGNTFYRNGKPLSVNKACDIDGSNRFHNPAAPLQTNTFNGIFVYDVGMNTALEWEETEVAYVIADQDFWLEIPLTLGDDVVLKFIPGARLLLMEGTKSLINYNGTDVYFTSYLDDTLKGDTNGDAEATSPAADDWEGIFDDSRSIDSPYYYEWDNILYDSH